MLGGRRNIFAPQRPVVGLYAAAVQPSVEGTTPAPLVTESTQAEERPIKDDDVLLDNASPRKRLRFAVDEIADAESRPLDELESEKDRQRKVCTAASNKATVEAPTQTIDSVFGLWMSNVIQQSSSTWIVNTDKCDHSSEAISEDAWVVVSNTLKLHFDEEHSSEAFVDDDSAQLAKFIKNWIKCGVVNWFQQRSWENRQSPRNETFLEILTASADVLHELLSTTASQSKVPSQWQRLIAQCRGRGAVPRACVHTVVIIPPALALPQSMGRALINAAVQWRKSCQHTGGERPHLGLLLLQSATHVLTTPHRANWILLEGIDVDPVDLIVFL